MKVVFQLLDAATLWLVSQGREKQWGTIPWSEDEKKRVFAEEVFKVVELGWIVEVRTSAALGAYSV